MGKYGLKIKNFQAGSIYEYNCGVRSNYDMKDAMLTNSLFLDYLYTTRFEVYKDTSTRDIICINFDYGSISYKNHQKKMQRLIDMSDDEEYKDRLRQVMEEAETKQDQFIELSADEIRKDFYQNGVTIYYKSHNYTKKIHYKMLYRTPGKAKNGACMFINERLYKKALDYLRMGIKLPKKNAPIVEIGAYSSLVTSTIIGKIKINPRNILILKDIDSFFETKAISVETNTNKECIAREIKNYKVKNTLFDGQALIDSSIFPKWADGFILLRHHFCKMASFKTNIQLFFKDYFGDEYETAIVIDMFGNEHLAKDIKLITTDNACKWLKFQVSYDYWCKKVNENGNLFGIVKTAHPSKLGSVQRMSYQMVNALSMDIMPSVVEMSKVYVETLKSSDAEFIKYLKANANFSNDYEVLVALCEQDYEFTRSEYYRDRKKTIIYSYVQNLKSGRLMQNADNLTIVGSPYAMLLHAVGEDVENDDTFSPEVNCTQCYTGRFDDGEYLAGFRSPFNGRNNLCYLHNVYNDKLFRYFDFGKMILAVNTLHTDIQDRANGCDFDSDVFFVTNHNEIVNHAKICSIRYPTIVNNIPKETNKYENTLLNFALIDNKLAAASRAIGESSNLAQLCLSYCYNFTDKKYQDYVCILAILAQCSIDNAKRTFDIDINKELRRIKKDIDVENNGYPLFFGKIRDKNAKKMSKEASLCTSINKNLQCPMNYLSSIEFARSRSNLKTLPMDYFFVQQPLELSRRKSKKVEALIEEYSLHYWLVAKNQENSILLMENFYEMVEKIKKTYISNNYIGLMSWLINRAFLITSNVKAQEGKIFSNLKKNRPLLLKTLYDVNKECFLKCFKSE